MFIYRVPQFNGPHSFPQEARSIGVLVYRHKIWNQIRFRVHDERFRQDKGPMASTKFNRSGFLAGTLISAVQKCRDQQLFGTGNFKVRTSV